MTVFHYIVDWEFFTEGDLHETSYITACGKNVSLIEEDTGHSLISDFINANMVMLNIKCPNCLKSEIFKENLIRFEIGFDGDREIERELVSKNYSSKRDQFRKERENNEQRNS